MGLIASVITRAVYIGPFLIYFQRTHREVCHILYLRNQEQGRQKFCKWSTNSRQGSEKFLQMPMDFLHLFILSFVRLLRRSLESKLTLSVFGYLLTGCHCY